MMVYVPSHFTPAQQPALVCAYAQLEILKKVIPSSLNLEINRGVPALLSHVCLCVAIQAAVVPICLRGDRDANSVTDK